jgi:4'-phosphopantetheinyl transferase
VLSHYLQCNAADIGIAFEANAKPHLSGDHCESNLYFNVAHSGDVALIAVTTGHELGIDIEVVRPVDHGASISRRYFHPSEVLAIQAMPPELRDAAFLRCWTGKEAVLKAVGTGISDSLATFAVSLDDRDYASTVDLAMEHANQKVWLRRLDVGPTYVAALAVVDADLPVRCMEFAM